MRLIDADDMKKHIVGNDEGIKIMMEWIDSQPTIKPQRMRGKWVKDNIVLTSNPPQYQWHCSECGTTIHGYSAKVLTNFCANCGADMRETE